MEIENSLQVLVPTVTYGNVTLAAKVRLNSVTDALEIEGEAVKMALETSGPERAGAVCRKLCVDEILKMKREVDRMTSEVWVLEKK